MSHGKLIPRLSVQSPVHRASRKVQATESPLKKEDSPLISKDSLEAGSEGLSPESTSQAGRGARAQDDMERDSLEESSPEDSLSETEEEASRKAAQAAGKDSHAQDKGAGSRSGTGLLSAGVSEAYC